jgi:hypothetical protein
MWFAFIVGILIIIGSIFYAIFSDLGDFSDVFIGFLISITATCFILMSSVLIGQEFKADEIYDTEKEFIIALKDNNLSVGHFFIGSGYIDSDLYYYYFTENEDDGKEFYSVKAKEVTLYDDVNKETAYIETKKMRNSNPIINFFFITDREKQEIHIPEGSVDYSFSVNLE